MDSVNTHPHPFLISTPLEASLFCSLGCHITRSVIQQTYITIVQGAGIKQPKNPALKEFITYQGERDNKQDKLVNNILY